MDRVENLGGDAFSRLAVDVSVGQRIGQGKPVRVAPCSLVSYVLIGNGAMPSGGAYRERGRFVLTNTEFDRDRCERGIPTSRQGRPGRSSRKTQ